jgi:hypothetical protein
MKKTTTTDKQEFSFKEITVIYHSRKKFYEGKDIYWYSFEFVSSSGKVGVISDSIVFLDTIYFMKVVDVPHYECNHAHKKVADRAYYECNKHHNEVIDFLEEHYRENLKIKAGKEI